MGVVVILAVLLAAAVAVTGVGFLSILLVRSLRDSPRSMEGTVVGGESRASRRIAALEAEVSDLHDELSRLRELVEFDHRLMAGDPDRGGEGASPGGGKGQAR